MLTCTLCVSIQLPKLLGPYPVGTRRIEAIDQGRLDPWAPTPQARALMLQLWYPIELNDSLLPAPWLPPNASAFLEHELELPIGILSLINTHVSYNGTAIFPLKGNDITPVLVFSPGRGALCEEYTTILSSLASYGYTIIGVNHPYDSTPLERLDGELVLGNTTTDWKLATIVRRDDVLWLASQITPDNICRWLPSHTDCNERLGSKISLGVFGHSLGGNTANWAMQDNATLYEASVSLDGAYFPPLNETGFHGPVLYMAASKPCCHKMLVETWPLIDGWKLALKINGTAHASFSDLIALTVYIPGKDLGDVGTLEPKRMIEIVVMYVKAFWDWNLLGKNVDDILQHESKLYPEIKFEDLHEEGPSVEYLRKQGN